MYHLIVVFLFAVVFTLLANYKIYSDDNGSDSSNNNSIFVDNRADVDAYSTLAVDQIEQMLIKLSKSRPPAKLSPGAMCYEMAIPPERVDYICPKDGTKTVYASSGPGSDGVCQVGWEVMADLAWEIDACRRLADQITKIDLELDESQFCKACSPDIENPQLGLVVKYPDGRVHRVWNIDSEDLVLIEEFLAGSKVHKDAADWETPLKDNLDRLQVLLGISLK